MKHIVWTTRKSTLSPKGWTGAYATSLIHVQPAGEHRTLCGKVVPSPSAREPIHTDAARKKCKKCEKAVAAIARQDKARISTI